MSDTGKRLQKLRKSLRLSQKSLSERLEFTGNGYVSAIERGERNITDVVLFRFQKKFPTVNISWLETGQGEMFLEKVENIGNVVSEPSGKYGKPGEEISIRELPELLASVLARLDALEKELAVLKKGK